MLKWLKKFKRLKRFKSQIDSARLNINSYRRKREIGRSIEKEKVNHFKKTLDCNYKWYGNSYGGFFIIPELLNRNSIVYSFGIGTDISFDKKVIKKHQCSVFGFDPTPQSISWINEQKNLNSFHFYKYGIGPKTEIVDFFLPANPKQISGSLLNHEYTDANRKVAAQMKTFGDIATELGHKHVDVVKMDIEGAEYQVLQTVLESSISIDQILVEFHDRLLEGHSLNSKIAVEMLKNKGYEIFACSMSYEEISFVHTRKINELQISRKISS